MTTLRTAAQQALEAWDSTVLPQSHDGMMQERMQQVEALHFHKGGDKVAPPLADRIALMRENERLRAALAEPQTWVCPDSAEHRYGKPGHCEDCGKTLVQVAEPIECEPQEAVTEDGWCEWVCPKPVGYLMQCCGCDLIHEVESRVAKYQPRPSEEFEVVDDPDLQVQWRMKRRDDISPKRKPLTEDEIALIVANCSASAHRHDDFSFARAIERAHGIGEQQ